MRPRDVTGLTGRHDDRTPGRPPRRTSTGSGRCSSAGTVVLVFLAVLPMITTVDRGRAVGHGRLGEQQVTARLRLALLEARPAVLLLLGLSGAVGLALAGRAERPGRRRPAARAGHGLRGVRRLPQRPRGPRDRPGEPARRRRRPLVTRDCRRSGRAAHGRRRRRRHGVGGRHPGARVPAAGAGRARRRDGVLPAARSGSRAEASSRRSCCRHCSSACPSCSACSPVAASEPPTSCCWPLSTSGSSAGSCSRTSATSWATGCSASGPSWCATAARATCALSAACWCAARALLVVATPGATWWYAVCQAILAVGGRPAGGSAGRADSHHARGALHLRRWRSSAVPRWRRCSSRSPPRRRRLRPTASSASPLSACCSRRRCCGSGRVRRG